MTSELVFISIIISIEKKTFKIICTTEAHSRVALSITRADVGASARAKYRYQETI